MKDALVLTGIVASLGIAWGAAPAPPRIIWPNFMADGFRDCHYILLDGRCAFGEDDTVSGIVGGSIAAHASSSTTVHMLWGTDQYYYRYDPRVPRPILTNDNAGNACLSWDFYTKGSSNATDALTMTLTYPDGMKDDITDEVTKTGLNRGSCHIMFVDRNSPDYINHGGNYGNLTNSQIPGGDYTFTISNPTNRTIKNIDGRIRIWQGYDGGQLTFLPVADQRICYESPIAFDLTACEPGSSPSLLP